MQAKITYWGGCSYTVGGYRFKQNVSTLVDDPAVIVTCRNTGGFTVEEVGAIGFQKPLEPTQLELPEATPSIPTVKKVKVVKKKEAPALVGEPSLDDLVDVADVADLPIEDE